MKKFLLFIFIIQWWANPLPAIENAFEQEIPKLTLSAQAILIKPADELHLTVGVVNTATVAQEALSQNNEKMQAVIDALEELGLAKAEYQTGYFSINPTYTPYPKNPPPEWKPTINGYEVRNSILIKTDKLSLAGQIIDTANRAGANEVNNIHFSLKDSRKYWPEALSAATQNALADAEVIAAAAGVKIQRILSVTLNNTPVVTPKSQVYAHSIGMEAISAPIEAGNVELQASVTVVFQI